MKQTASRLRTIWALAGSPLSLALVAALLPGQTLADTQPAATLSSAAIAAAPAPHLRVLPLQGGRNFRDLGGYRTIDGRHVKWGLLFRSGSMHGLTPADYAYLEGRGIRVVCDLRSTTERNNEPVNWPADHAPAVLTDDYLLADSGAMPKGDMRHWNARQSNAAMAATYPQILKYFAGQYRRMFAELLAGHAPLAVNCSAGKDRTGVASALLLTALGVPRKTVIADYELTNRTLDSSAFLKGTSASAMMLSSLPAPALHAILSADRGNIAAALAVVDAHPGGADGYFRDEMNLSRDDLRRLRALYLER